MIKHRITAKVADLVLNTGQLDWLPKNPRTFTQEDIDLTVASLKRDPDFQEDNPLKVVPLPDGKLLVFAGNLRTTSARLLKWQTFEAMSYTPESEEDRETIRRRAILDNGSFGSWDADALANEWPEASQLREWGVSEWVLGGAGRGMSDAQRQMENGGLSSNGKDMGEGYGEFVDKFKPKLTTDDCYTPPEVYDVVRDFVNEKVVPLKGRKVIRPFFPGGDFEDLAQYPKRCIVIDNPPFSIYAKIVRFYLEHHIDFFLFAPALTALVQGADVCYILPAAAVEYENGAVVSTAFITNLVPGTRFWIETTIRQAIEKAQHREAPDLGNYAFPPCVWTAARLQKIAKGDDDFRIPSEFCEYVHNLDQMKAEGKGLFGGGVLIADAIGEAAERAAERAAAIKYHLTKTEREVVERLNAKYESSHETERS